MLYRVQHLAWAGFKPTTLVVIDTDCISSYESNYHMITTASTYSRISYFYWNPSGISRNNKKKYVVLLYILAKIYVWSIYKSGKNEKDSTSLYFIINYCHGSIKSLSGVRGCRGRMVPVVQFRIAYTISAYHHWSCECEPCWWRGVLDTTLCDKVCQWLATGRWFSPGTPASATVYLKYCWKWR